MGDDAEENEPIGIGEIVTQGAMIDAAKCEKVTGYQMVVVIPNSWGGGGEPRRRTWVRIAAGVPTMSAAA